MVVILNHYHQNILKLETIEEVFEQEYEDDELAKAYREYYAEYLELPSRSIKM